jgi:predicted nuclease of restriction endonuclease-like (RecB) superfamily
MSSVDSEISKISINSEYKKFLEHLKNCVKASRSRASNAINSELLLLYHQIGTEIINRQSKEGWGAKIIDLLSRDLTSAFPQIKGFSSRNLKYMRLFAATYPNLQFVQEVLAQLTWYHNLTLIEKIKDKEIKDFYIFKTIEQGWSRDVMVKQIEAKLHQRQSQAITNFKEKLSLPHADLAINALKDPYIFDFLGIGHEAQEREVEKALTEHMEKFILELGAGFAFVGRQYNINVGGQDFYIDLLFYHLKLRCFVVIELKDKDFKPEHAGKMNFYLSAVDELLKHPSDNPSIGLILCKSKNNVLAEYTLRDMSKPIGLAEYNLDKALPDDIKVSLPSIEELEAKLSEI